MKSTLKWGWICVGCNQYSKTKKTFAHGFGCSRKVERGYLSEVEIKIRVTKPYASVKVR